MANSSGSGKIVRRLILFCLLAYCLVSGAAQAATLTGSLASGQFAYYDITLPTPQSGLRLVLSTSASSDFSLYTGINHSAGTQVAASYGQTLHTLLIAAGDPNLADGGQYHVRIKANASLSYSYTADLTYLRALTWDNGTTLAGVNIINQPDSAGGDYLFRVTGQSPLHPGWRNVLKVTAGEADLYLQQDNPPLGGGSYSSTAVGSDAIYIPADSSLSGQTWYIRVHATPGATWQLGSGDLYVQNLTWDNGSAPGGSSNIGQPSSGAGEYFFRITSQAPTTGAWRTVLNVLGGEANFYLQQDSIPFGDTSYKSTVTGSDGLILAANQYADNQTWYIRVHATSSSTWNIFSGEIHARDIGTVGDISSIAAATIGPEGTFYYRTSVDATTKAWRLWLNGGGQTIWVRQSSAPVKTVWTEQAEQFEVGQMLLVPPYLTNAVYFIGVTGTPGSSITLDSRRQPVTTLSFSSSAGNSINGYGYTTYRVDVPIDQIAWQINLTPGAVGQNPQLYIRSGDVPNRWTNSALSEAPAGVIDSITQVPPTLTDGTWYITVYGSGTFSYTLANLIPTVTGKPFINTSDPNPVPPGYAYPYNTTPIINDDINRSGWRYYQVSDINSQLGFLGWQLDLDAAHQTGREIALRRNAVPASWSYRNGNSAYVTNVSESSHVDASSTYGFLQRPGHQADIWYIGINTPNQAMGAFQLTTREIPAPLKQVNSSSTAVSSQIANTWQWFKFTVPSSTDPNNAKYEPNFLGWDLRLKATLGNPRMVIRRDQLPADFNSQTGYNYGSLENMNNWQTGWQWAPGIGDMYYSPSNGLGGPTRRYLGDRNSYLIAGMGSPLEAGSYYVGVSGDGSDTAALSYTLESRGIGIGNDASSVPWPIQVVDLGNFTGGSVSKTGLAPREAAYYRITVPAAQKSWSVKLEPTLGEALMTVRQGAIPNMTANNGQPSDSIYYFNGNRRQKAGREFFHKYAESPQTAISAGTYYIAVFSEGQNPPDDNTIGSGSVNFTLTSYGLMPVADKTSTPAAVGTPVTWNGETLQYGQQKVYRFRVPAGLTSMEIRLKNRVGNPTMALRQDAAGSGMIPGPYNLTYVAHEGGYTPQWSNDTLITVPQPVAGDYTLVVAATPLNSGPPNYTTSYPDASFDVEVIVQGLVALPFTNGNIPVSGQEANTWRFYQVSVPAGALGWDLRLKATLGNPRMVIRRDQLPADFNTNTGYNYGSLENMNNWQTGWQWAPGIGDMYYSPSNGLGGPTRRYSGDRNSYLIAGMGSPLEAGSYYVGVSGDGSDTAALSYTLESRGIGIGNDASSVPWPIQVQDLGNFTGGSASKTGLAPREAAYYRITVPAAQKSWSVKLEPTLGEALMTVRQGAIPNMTANNGQPSDSIYYFNGNRRQKAGREFFHKYAESPQTAISAGTYYIAVFSEGQNPPDDNTIGSGSVNFTLTSYGLMPVADKTSTPAAVGTPVTWNGETLQYGQQKVYRFRVPAGLTSMEIRLKNRVGNPTMALRQDAAGSGMIPGRNGLDYIAHEGGYDSQWSNDTLITVPQPVAGDYSLVVAAAQLNSGPPSYTISYPDASCDVEVTVQGLVVLPFTNGSIPVSGQEANTWRFFQVSVPAGALGWDLRLKASLGNPRMVVRRDQLPADFNTNTGYYSYYLDRMSSWQTGLQWAPGIGDAAYNSYYSWSGPTRRYSGDKNSYLITGMGSPLEAGSYYVGVSGDGSDTAPLSYTLESRGIGIGNDASSVPWPIQVQDLGNFTGGSVSKTGLVPREAAYYRITVPAAQKSWSVKLEPTLGEALMTVRQGALPNMTAQNHPSDSIYYFNGNRRQKAGREFFHKYAESPQSAITAGTYYIAVFSEGQNPPDNFTIGSGNVNFTLTSYGLMPVADKTSTPAAVGSPVTWNGETLQYGQQKVYRFRVPAGLTSMEIRLKNRVGNPTMALRQDAAGSGMIPGKNGLDYIAHEGGYDSQWANDTLITVPQPVAGDYTLVVANKQNCLPNWPYTCSDTDNSYDVEVTVLTPTTLILDNGSASGSLVDQQIRYYQVSIPATVNGYPLSGWKIGTSASNGSAKLYIAKNGIPNATNQPTLEVTSPFAVLTAPYLEPGTWYIAVQGVGITDYSITSEIISADPDRNSRSWAMPAASGSFTQPGLTAPWFGDSGIDNSGNPIINPSTGDQGTDLGENDWHFYRIVIPAGNGGILKSVVEALSGKPELYIRKGGVPSPYHRSDANDPNYYNSYAPYAYDRLQSLNGTMYGNWVPLDRRSELQLAPGEWWLGIKAVNSNIRYRLRVAAGNVRDAIGPLDSSGYFQDLNLVSGSKTGQTLAAGDMRYYRLIVPQSSTTQSLSTPTAWNLTLNQQVGDVAILIRDTIPPGLGADGNLTTYLQSFMDWGDDNSYVTSNPYITIETAGTTTINTPPLRPGATYYLGVFAKTDATFDISSGIGTEKLKLDGVIPFANGLLSTTLAAGEQRLYRIDVPSDALVWHHTALHDGGIRFYLAQGTVPPNDSYAHWYTYGNADSYLNQNLSGYPWQPGYSYYLLVENTTGGALPFTFTMSGKSVLSRLTLSISATCPGSSVTTSPDLFTCTSGTCSADVMPYTGISLYVSPGAGCAPTTWTGACLSSGSNYYCSLPMDQSVTTSIGFVDNGAPTITFSIPDSSTTSNVAVTLGASDNVGVTGYCLNETGNSGTCVWSSLPPATYTFSGLTDNTPTGRGLYAFSRDAAGNISSAYDYITITVTEATLSVTLAGSGSGSVNSSPTGLSCTSGTCSRNFALNSTVGLLATPGADSIFGGWSGACGGSGACSVSMSIAKAVTATFNLLPPVRLNRTTPLYYSTLQEAYNAATGGDVIQLKEGTLAGSLNTNRAIAVSLKGGYNASYSAVSSNTLLQGTVTLGLGSVVMDRVNIK